MAFRYGDILHVTNASDDEWWQGNVVCRLVQMLKLKIPIAID